MKYIQNDKINQRQLDNEVMLILPRYITEQYSPEKSDDTLLFLEKTGYEIWDSIREGRTMLEIIQHMQLLYDVDEETLRKDVEIFLKQGITLGIIIELND